MHFDDILAWRTFIFPLTNEDEISVVDENKNRYLFTDDSRIFIKHN